MVTVASYFDTIFGTAGLVNLYRMGETTISSDSFTDTAATNLTAHTGELGGAWIQPNGNNVEKISTANRAYRNGNDYAIDYSSATPASADYAVEADLFYRGTLANDTAGVIGRFNTGATSFYVARWSGTNTTWNIAEVSSGTTTVLATTGAQSALVVGQSYRLRLELSGSSSTVLELYVNGTLMTSFTDVTAPFTAVGKAGFMDGAIEPPAVVKSDTVGLHFDNFLVTPRIVDTKSGNTGDLGGVSLGVAGAIAGDANTAAQFDGMNGYATVTRQIADDFSIEFWFKSTQGISTGTQWWNGAGLVDAEVNGAFNDFGVSLRSDGRVLAGVGPTDTTIVSTSGGYNNGTWHHVVFTRTKASGALALYVDGVAAGTATGSTVSLASPADINFGRLHTGTNYYSGSLDEVALYSSVLGPTTVSAHYNAAQ